jgi:poly(3-hydroxybutyrate) depolymerase
MGTKTTFGTHGFWRGGTGAIAAVCLMLVACGESTSARPGEASTVGGSGPGDGGAPGPSQGTGGGGGPMVLADGGQGTGGGSGNGGVPSGDGGKSSVADGGGPIGQGPCTITDQAALCASQPIVTIVNGTDTRRVYWNEPTGTPSAAGRPAVILYQGSIYGPSLTWDVSLPKSTAFGGYVQLELIAMLIDNGFVVVQPEAQGGIAWNTNTGSNYDTSPDAVFIPNLLSDMAKGTFGAIDMNRLYATGISSGGYMTSRMAVSYPGRFRALAIESASYATCGGPLCTVPAVLPADHPPTLLLHGDADNIVPIATAKDYYQKLLANGIEARFVEDPIAGHQWIDAAPKEVTAWFQSH